jgi:hypothetical protein
MAYLDGELLFYQRFTVRRHIQACWECRLRLDEIERQVLEFTRAIKEDTFPGGHRWVDARLGFLARANILAGEVFAASRKPVPAASVRRLAWAAGGLFLVVGTWGVTRRAQEAQTPTPREVMTRVEMAEVKAVRGPVHQRFRLVARQIRPAAVQRESCLELWYEPDHGRFAARVEDPAGTLRHAIWQPEPSRQYIYNPLRADRAIRVSRTETKARWSTILFREGLNLEDLEAGLVEWIEKRQWEPLAMSSGVALFVSQEGATLHAEVFDKRRLRLSAVKVVGRITVVFTLEVDAPGYQPRLQSIRYESPARTLELTFVPEMAGDVMVTSFEPPISLLRLARKPIIPDRPGLKLRQPQWRPSQPDLTELEIELWYALHRVGACLGEPVEVLRQPDETLLVRGVASTPERRQQLMAVLAAFMANPAVRVEMQTTEEALREIPAQEITLSATPQHVSPAPVHAFLEKYFSRTFKAPSRAAERFEDEALSRSDGLMAEAWALRRLAERFTENPDADPHSRARSLLAAMVHDHLRELRLRAGETQEFLVPALSSIPATSALTPPGRRSRDAGDTWQHLLVGVFDDLASLNNRLVQLFTGGQNPRSPESLVPEIFAGLRAVAAGAQDAAESLAGAFPASTASAGQEHPSPERPE